MRSHHPSTPAPRCQAPACCPLTPLHSVSGRRCLAASSARWAPAGSSAELFFILFTTVPAFDMCHAVPLCSHRSLVGLLFVFCAPGPVSPPCAAFPKSLSVIREHKGTVGCSFSMGATGWSLGTFCSASSSTRAGRREVRAPAWGQGDPASSSGPPAGPLPLPQHLSVPLSESQGACLRGMGFPTVL